MARPIGTLGTIETLTIGGRVFTDMTNLITLVAGLAAGSSHCSFRKPNGTAGYAVTGGKTLTLSAVQIQINAADLTRLLYSDNDVSPAAATAWTNAVYQGGNNSQSSYIVTGVTPTGTIISVNTNFQVLAGKYAGVENGGTAVHTFYAYGYEV